MKILKRKLLVVSLSFVAIIVAYVLYGVSDWMQFRRVALRIEEHGGLITMSRDTDSSGTMRFRHPFVPPLTGVSVGGLKDLSDIGPDEEISEDDLQALQLLQGFTRLDLDMLEMNDKLVKHLVNLESVTELHFSGSSVTDVGLADLDGVPNLRRLYLNDCNISGQSFDHLARSCPQLESLFLMGTKLSSEGAEKLRLFRQLRCLDLSEGALDYEILTHVSKIESLERLFLMETSIGDEECRLLQKLPNLRALDLIDTQVGPIGLKRIASISTLEELALNSLTLTAEAIECLAPLVNLKTLHIATIPLGYGFILGSPLVPLEINSRFPETLTIESRYHGNPTIKVREINSKECNEALTELLAKHKDLRVTGDWLMYPWRDRQWPGQHTANIVDDDQEVIYQAIEYPDPGDGIF